MKPIIGLAPIHTGSFVPSGAGLGMGVKFRNIGFDIQQRRIVEHIHIGYEENTSLSSQKSDY